MSKKLYEETNIQDIANAIRAKNGTQNQYTVAKMGNAVRAITTQPNLESLNVTENGNYLPSANKDGFSSVSVNVEGGGSAVVQSLSVTENGTYNPPSGVDGYAPVTVNVSGGSSSKITLIDYDMMRDLHIQSYNSGDYSRIVAVIGNGATQASRLSTSTQDDDGYRLSIYRSGYDNYGYTFLQKIPASSGMNKMVIRMTTTSPATYKNVEVCLARSLGMDKYGYPTSSIKEVLRLTEATNWTTYEIDISDIQEDFYVNIRNCDLAYYIDSLYFE